MYVMNRILSKKIHTVNSKNGKGTNKTQKPDCHPVQALLLKALNCAQGMLTFSRLTEGGG